MSAVEHDLYRRYLSVCELACANGTVLCNVDSFSSFCERVDCHVGCDGGGAVVSRPVGGVAEVAPRGVVCRGGCVASVGESGVLRRFASGCTGAGKVGAVVVGSQGDGDVCSSVCPGRAGSRACSEVGETSLSDSVGRDVEVRSEPLCVRSAVGAAVQETSGEVASSVDEPAGGAGGGVVGKNTLRNREWRKQKKSRKERKKLRDVSDWRVKAPRAPVHVGYFSQCSDEVKSQLVDSRARMLVAKNEAAVVKAEVESRRTRALLKSQEVERSVELRRLKTEASLKVEVDRKFGVNYSTGFARTVISEGLEDVISVPSLSSGTVSPDSSVSVEQVQKMEGVIARQAQELSELRSRLEAFALAKVEGSVGAVPVVNSRFPIGFEEEKAAWDAIDYDPSYHEGMTGLGDSEIRESEAIYDRTKANGFMSEEDMRRNNAINEKVFEFRRREKLERALNSG